MTWDRGEVPHPCQISNGGAVSKYKSSPQMNFVLDFY
jgi:hypothetical protein